MTAVGEHGAFIFITVFCLTFVIVLGVATSDITGSPELFAGSRYEGYQSPILPSQFFDNNTAANLTWISYEDYALPVNLVFPPPLPSIPFVEFDGHYVGMRFSRDYLVTGNVLLGFTHFHQVLLGIPVPFTDYDMIPYPITWDVLHSRMDYLNTTTPWFFLTCTVIPSDFNCTVLVGYDSDYYSSLQESWDAGWVYLRVGLTSEQAGFHQTSFDYWSTFWAIVTFDSTYFPSPLDLIFKVVFVVAIVLVAIFIWTRVKPF
jgi:hypothetical protein